MRSSPQKRVDFSTSRKLDFFRPVYSTSFWSWSKTWRKITWKTRLFGTTFRLVQNWSQNHIKNTAFWDHFQTGQNWTQYHVKNTWFCDQSKSGPKLDAKYHMILRSVLDWKNKPFNIGPLYSYYRLQNSNIFFLRGCVSPIVTPVSKYMFVSWDQIDPIFWLLKKSKNKLLKCAQFKSILCENPVYLWLYWCFGVT